jgi:hypothetical protein
LWSYRYEGAALRYLNQWIDQLRWQRLEPFKKLAEMLLSHSRAGVGRAAGGTGEWADRVGPSNGRCR